MIVFEVKHVTTFVSKRLHSFEITDPKTMFVFYFILFSADFMLKCDSLPWSYHEKTSWKDNYPTCGGVRQSPINIVTRDTTEMPGHCAQFNFSSSFYRPIAQAEIFNTGTAYHINDLEGGKLIGGACLNSVYQLLQFHFHLGTPEVKLGSENRVNGHQFPGEVHFVFANTNASELTSSSSYFDDRFAVLAFFIQVEQTSEQENNFWEAILDSIMPLNTTDVFVDLSDRLKLSDLIPFGDEERMSKFYRYKGSLTTPPCTETGIWNVFQQPLSISNSQYERFFIPEKSDTETRPKNNFRYSMELYGRTVYRTAKASFAYKIVASYVLPYILLVLLLSK